MNRRLHPGLPLAMALLALAGCPSRHPAGGAGESPDAEVIPDPPDAAPPVPDAGPAVCGDGACSAGEWCVCLEDCGPCMSVCGDGWCQYGFEDCTTCPSECGTCPGTCGDGRCDEIERCWECPEDCGMCTGCDHSVCEVGPPLAEGCDACTAAVCGLDPSCCTTDWTEFCVAAADMVCLVACTPTVCGDLVCDREGGETCFTCAQDCECLACEHTVCETGPPLTADCAPCVLDVCSELPYCCRDVWDQACVVRTMETCWVTCGGFCGDSICAASEQCCEWCSPCEADCDPCCGDGVCTTVTHYWPPEECSPLSCEADCCEPVCGDGVCADVGESCRGCPGDCGVCLANCGDGECVRNQGEHCGTCPSDCPTCP